MTKKIEPRPKSLSYLMIVPAIFAALLIVAIGSLAYLMSKGDIASGERVAIRMSGECIQEAIPIMKKRVEAVGLGDPVYTNSGAQWSIVATLPDIPNAKESISKLLSRRGILEMRHGNKVVMDRSDIESATLGLDEGGMPETMLVINGISIPKIQERIDKFPNDLSEIWLDDEFLINRPNTIKIGEEFRLVSEATDPVIRMQQSIDFVILLSLDVLPCQLRIESVNTSTD